MTAREQLPDDGNLNAEQPWLGLVSFSENLSSYFHGREEEVGELTRRVQRKTLTILFGQSGLGKTSILNAGVVPRLRGQGFCPVYVRIDYADGTPSPSEQIKQAVLRETRAQGKWTQSGVAIEGESLWEFLHHRDDLLHDAEGKPVLPLLIFDQFEELFTLAQSDEAGRQKAALFIADLADLVENRAPQALEARMQDDDAAAEAFDFSRSDYRVLIALREDYLAQLEGLKAQMPSITQNRMRLAPMTGTQAMAAVRGPGAHLVSDEVAGAIVRFVAGGAELANAEVEPSLLSLICRELNDARLAKGQDEITVDLLAGSHAAILSDFYERSLADQPAALRAFIEDVLLTDSGYRENVAEERVRREFSAAGATPDALALLVNRRLLRIEERLDLRRVELTHDVLSGVVKSSRDARHEREAREESERQLAAQAERAREARLALHKARRVAVVCIFLTVGALGATGYAYWSSQRAKAAETLAVQARNEAEGVMGYLLDDFYAELDPLNRLDIVVSLGERAVEYYRQLPEGLRNRETARNQALAQLRLGEALAGQNKVKEGSALLTEAVQGLERLRAGGDTSEASLVGLALALGSQGRAMVLQGQADAARPLAERAASLLQAPAADAHASVSVLRGNARVLLQLSYLLSRAADSKGGAKAGLDSMAMAARLGGADSTDPTQREAVRATADYANAAAWAVASLQNIDPAKAREIGALGLKRLAWLLSVQPEHGTALYARALTANFLASVERTDLNMAGAIQHGLQGAADYERLAQRDPSSGRNWVNLGSAWSVVAGAQHEAGQIEASTQNYEKSIAATAKARVTLNTLRAGIGRASPLVVNQADSGKLAAATATITAMQTTHQQFAKLAGPQSAKALFASCLLGMARLDLALAGQGGTTTSGPALAKPLQEAAHATDIPPGELSELHWNCLRPATLRLGTWYLLQRDYTAAEGAFTQAIKSFEIVPLETLEDSRDLANMQIGLALAQVRLGRLEQARATLAPALKLESELDARTTNDSQFQRLEMAQVWFVQALVEPSQRASLLARAAARIKALPPEMQGLHSVARWRDWIAAEQKAKA